MMRVKRTTEFNCWLEGMQEREQSQVEARFYRIAYYDHFGDIKNLGDGLWELRWANGKRVYFGYSFDSAGNLIIVLLGGLKNGQKKDIKKARLLAKKYKTHDT